MNGAEPAGENDPRLVGGVLAGATVVSAIAIIAAWCAPWMGGSSALPLIGHGFTWVSWFLAEAPGTGTSMLMVLLGVAELLALWLALSGLAQPARSTHIVAAGTAAAGSALAWLLAVRGHPGLSSGPGPGLTAAACATLASCQAALAVCGGVRWRGAWWRAAVAGASAAIILVAAAWYGSSAMASARDVDATTAAAAPGNYSASAHNAELSGVSVRDTRTGTERWHHYERGWGDALAGLTADGRTVLLLVNSVGERDAVGFDASTGVARWQARIGDGQWPRSAPVGRPVLPLPARPAIGPGLLLLTQQSDTLRYLDGADGHSGLVRLDEHCRLIGGGGVDALYLVEQCDTTAKVLAYERDGRRRWSVPVFEPIADSLTATIADTDGAVTVAVGGLTATLDLRTGDRLRLAR